LLKTLTSLGVGFGAGYLLSQIPRLSISLPEYHVIRKESYVSPASVIVFKEGDYAVAIDGKTKEIIEMSKDHGKVIQKAIDYLMNGGRIIIKKGNYNIKSAIYIRNSNITLSGEGAGTVLSTTGMDETFIIIGYDTSVENIIIRNLQIDGTNLTEPSTKGIENNINGCGILIYTTDTVKVKKVLIEGVYVKNIPNEAIASYCSVYQQEIHGIIRNCFIKNPGHRAIHLHNDHSWIIIGNVILGGDNEFESGIRHGEIIAYNYFYNCKVSVGCILGSKPCAVICCNHFQKCEGIGIRTWNEGDLVLGNVFIDHKGINVRLVGGGICALNSFYYPGGDSPVIEVAFSNSYIIGNRIYKSSTVESVGGVINIKDAYDNVYILYNLVQHYYNDQGYLVYFVNSKPTNVVVGNILVGGRVKIHDPSGNVVIKHNIGYQTENHGIATITGDGTTTTFTVDVEHGLVTDDISKICVTITPSKPCDVSYDLVDKDSDGFKETLRITLTFGTAPADGEVIYVSWCAEVVS